MPRPVKIAESSSIFAKGYKKKSREHQGAVDEALRLMESDLTHRSLRARKVVGHKTVWEAHATLQVVLTFEFLDERSIRLRNCCRHDIYRRP